MLDVLVSGATVYDGTGSDPVIADIGIKGDTITDYATTDRIPPEKAREVVNAEGFAVAPGFIDLHQHCDFTIQGNPDAPSQISQGVTTVLTGNCGSSPFPATSLKVSADSWAHLSPEFIEDHPSASGFMDTVSKCQPEINVAFQVGLSSVRRMAMGDAARPANDVEIAEMKRQIDVAAEAGVRGFSTGLIYAPGAYAPPHEVRELVRHASSHKLLYSTHMRDEGDGLRTSIQESIEAVGRVGKLEISHFKSSGKNNHGKMRSALEQIEHARSEGVDVTCDVYPYMASSTTLTSLFPDWSLDEGRTALPRRCANPKERTRIREHLREMFATSTAPNEIVIAKVSDEGPGGFEWAVGNDLGTVAERLACDPEEAAIVLIEHHAGGVGMIQYSMSEDDVREALQYTHASIASDGHVLADHGPGHPHPRNFGTFTRVLGNYVREEKVLNLTDAIRKMTSLPASRLNLDDRGVIANGKKADLVVFDPKSVDSLSTWKNPWQLSKGIRAVLVNGTFALRDGQFLRGRAGRVI